MRFVGVRQHVDAKLLAVEFKNRLAVAGFHLVERVVVVFDDGQIDAADFAEVGREFEADIAKAHDDPRLGECGRIQYVRTRGDVDLIDAGEVGDVEYRSRRDDDVIWFEASAAFLEFDHAVVDESGRVVDELDGLALGQFVDVFASVLGKASDMLVFPGDDGLGIYFGNALEAVVVARLIPVLASREDVLTRHAATENTQSTTGVAVVD